MVRTGSATSSPLAPPPPPPPPPPQLELDGEVELLAKEAAATKKKMDFREILALFHDRPVRMDPVKRERAWEDLWQTTLAEAQEEHRQLRKNGNGNGGKQDDAPSRMGAGPGGKHGSVMGSSGPEPPKRPRQSSGADLEPNKLSRLNPRAPTRPKTGSKLMQKLGARGT